MRFDIYYADDLDRPIATYHDTMSAHVYAKRLSANADVVMHEIDNHGDVVHIHHFPRRTTIRRRPYDIHYNPVGLFGTIYHNIGLIVRLAFAAFLASVFINAISSNSITVALPSSANTTTMYDLSTGMKSVLAACMQYGAILLKEIETYLAAQGGIP